MDTLLYQAVIYLISAVICVPIANRFGLGSVLGYLLAGIIIGPVAGLVGDETADIQHFAEFGVVMMLFVVGLELEPAKLWEMRHRLLGLGGLQVGLTAAIITGAGLLFGLDWHIALVIGLIFSLSSTAIVLQTLNEKGLSATEGGRASFSVLLFQDIAVIPMLALIPLLAVAGGGDAGHAAAHGTPAAAALEAEGGHHGASMSLVDGLSAWAHAGVVLLVIAAVLLGGRYLTRPLFNFIASARLQEIFTAAALGLVIGIALLMTMIELSPALGTFLAGVVLANSEFRHELESDIAPFKGLLLGLFFITVGAGIDFGVLVDQTALVLGLTVGVMAVKAAVLFGLSKLFRIGGSNGLLFTAALAQAGEFGFVLLNFSSQNQVLPPDLVAPLSLVVALSMLFTPGLFIFYERVLSQRTEAAAEAMEPAIDKHGRVIIAGLGRYGQIVARMLRATGAETVVLDHDASIITRMARFGMEAHYGDPTRPELLEAAGIEHADLMVVAIDDKADAVELVEMVKRRHPGVKILARAYDLPHQYMLDRAGADHSYRETFEVAVQTGRDALVELGVHPFRARRMARGFRRHDAMGTANLYESWDEVGSMEELMGNKAFIERAMRHQAQLADWMEGDEPEAEAHGEGGWTPPPRDYIAELGGDEAAPGEQPA